MPDSGKGAPEAPLDTQTAEQKMRRALGLHGSNRGSSGGQHGRTPQQRPDQARQRHRFVQDGGVPVVVVNHRADEASVLTQKVADLERMLEVERGQHANTRRALQEAQAAGQSAETRLVHAGLAHQEALNGERRALAVAQEALAAAHAQLAARGSAGRRAVVVAKPEVVAEVSEPAVAAETPVVVAEPAEAKKRGRPRTRPLPEPKPVRWWTPSFRAKTKA